MLKSKSQEQAHLIQPEMKGEEGEYKEAYFLANNWISYIKFLHRVLKFVEASSEVEMGDVARGITKCLFEEMEKFKSVLEGGENQPKCKEWKEFVEYCG